VTGKTVGENVGVCEGSTVGPSVGVGVTGVTVPYGETVGRSVGVCVGIHVGGAEVMTGASVGDDEAAGPAVGS